MDPDLERLVADTVVVNGETVVGRDFSGVKTPQFESIGSEFVRCRFDSMRIGTALMASGRIRSTYRDCSFDGIRIKHIMGGPVRFERCTFRNVNIVGWTLQAADLIDCAFTGQLRAGRGGGTLWGAPTPHWRSEYRKRSNEVRGNDFSGCSLVDMDFRRGVDLRLQVLPTGPAYAYAEDGLRAVTQARSAVGLWQDDDRRRDGLFIVDLLLSHIRDGQEQVFVSNMSGYLNDIWPELRHALTL